MNILKLKFELEDGKTKMLSIKNAKDDVNAENIKSFAQYLINNKVINTGASAMKKLVSAVLANTSETTIQL